MVLSLLGVACASADHYDAMVNTASTTGGSMPNARFQVGTSDPAFWIGKCKAGDGDVCRLVAGSFSHGGTFSFGYFPQDDVKAAEFYSLGCQFGEPRSCGELGSALVAGRGIAKDAAKGLPLLVRSCTTTASHHCYEAASGYMKTDEAAAVKLYRRGCSAGDKPSCNMVAYYDGTGTFSTALTPVGALGYLFGMPMPEAAKNCTSAGFRFTSSGRWNQCSGSQTPQNFAVGVEQCDGRVCSVYLVSNVTGGGVAAIRQYNELEAELTKRYGDASTRKRAMPDACTSDQTFGDCLKQGRAQMEAVWLWESKPTVGLQLIQRPDGGLANTILYSSALSSERSRGSGL